MVAGIDFDSNLWFQFWRQIRSKEPLVPRFWGFLQKKIELVLVIKYSKIRWFSCKNQYFLEGDWPSFDFLKTTVKN